MKTPDDIATPTDQARRILAPLLLLALLAWAAKWTWHQRFMETPKMAWRLWRMAPAQQLPSPVDGVQARQIADTFGAPRGRGRHHAGVDIFARRGTPVRSATHGIVTSIRDGGLGGKQVWVLGPGNERYYHAHLDAWAPGLREGRSVLPGDLLGYVGTTGNARGTPAHLHYGIYGRAGARDPLPALRAWQRQGTLEH